MPTPRAIVTGWSLFEPLCAVVTKCSHFCKLNFWLRTRWGFYLWTREIRNVLCMDGVAGGLDAIQWIWLLTWSRIELQFRSYALHDLHLVVSGSTENFLRNYYLHLQLCFPNLINEGRLECNHQPHPVMSKFLEVFLSRLKWLQRTWWVGNPDPDLEACFPIYQEQLCNSYHSLTASSTVSTLSKLLSFFLFNRCSHAAPDSSPVTLFFTPKMPSIFRKKKTGS